MHDKGAFLGRAELKATMLANYDADVFLCEQERQRDIQHWQEAGYSLEFIEEWIPPRRPVFNVDQAGIHPHFWRLAHNLPFASEREIAAAIMPGLDTIRAGHLYAYFILTHPRYGVRNTARNAAEREWADRCESFLYTRLSDPSMKPDAWLNQFHDARHIWDWEARRLTKEGGTLTYDAPTASVLSWRTHLGDAFAQHEDELLLWLRDLFVEVSAGYELQLNMPLDWSAA